MSRGPQDGNQWVIRWKTGLARDRAGQASRSDGEGQAACRELAEGLPLKGPQLQGLQPGVGRKDTLAAMWRTTVKAARQGPRRPSGRDALQCSRRDSRYCGTGSTPGGDGKWICWKNVLETGLPRVSW